MELFKITNQPERARMELALAHFQYAQGEQGNNPSQDVTLC